MYLIEINPLSHFTHSSLKNIWFEVQQNAKTNFFLSWPWIDSWLTQIATTSNTYLVTAKSSDNQVVGIALFCEKQVTRHGFIQSKQWYLHRTGDDTLDQIWIEKNALLTTTKNAQQIALAMWHYLFENCPSVDEFIVDVSLTESIPNLTNNQYKVITTNFDLGYKTKLNAVGQPALFPSEISKSTFKHVKRTIKLIESQGQVTFRFVTQPSEINDILDQYHQWHVDKWQTTETPSGFTNQRFVDFHRHLVATHEHSTRLFVVELNGELIGFHYYLYIDSKLYFYLASIQPSADNKVKLGLALHTKATEFAFEDALTEIDYLAGEANYKSKFATDQERYCKIVIQKKSLRFSIEHVLKGTLNFIKNRM